MKSRPKDMRFIPDVYDINLQNLPEFIDRTRALTSVYYADRISYA